MPKTETTNIAALDVGERRVGVAVAHKVARLPRPLTTLERGDNFWETLKKLLVDESAGMVVIGIPRNLKGDDTAQSAATQAFIQELTSRIDLPIASIDEALTSREAEAELQARGKPYTKGDIDALAATHILKDYLSQKNTAT